MKIIPTQIKEVYYAGSIYKVEGLVKFPHGLMIAIKDEPNQSNHIDFIKPENCNHVYPCYSCQGGGCPSCSGCGNIIGSKLKFD